MDKFLYSVILRCNNIQMILFSDMIEVEGKIE